MYVARSQGLWLQRGPVRVTTGSSPIPAEITGFDQEECRLRRWMHREDSFFVLQAYFQGANDPYMADDCKKAPVIDEEGQH